MLSVADGAFGPLQKGAVNWSNRLRQAAAVCHSLTPLGRGTVVCDVAEKTIFKVVEAQFLVMHCHLKRVAYLVLCALCARPGTTPGPKQHHTPTARGLPLRGSGLVSRLWSLAVVVIALCCC